MISFGPFRLHPERRLLLEGDRPLRLGSRALEILIALIEHAGELVSKDDLMARVWLGMTVEESNLKVHVSALRRALADGRDGNRYILTVSGRGYSFIAPIDTMEGTSTPPVSPTEHLHNLPAMLTRLVGRADSVGKLAQQLPRQRFVTIVGTGGVGKTSLALTLAEALLSTYPDGVRLVDLAPLADARLVPAALAAVLGLELRADDLLPGLILALRDKLMLLMLDNCDRVIGAAAALAAAIQKEAPGVHILATSREPLRVKGEHVCRLQPLASPARSTQPTAAEALAFPAVQLFVERAADSLGEFVLSDAEAPVVADICRKLDGVPLAIEFAAARVDAFGVRGLASRLDDRLRLLTTGRRTALPRHQTMRATLDWSYEVLSEIERVVLQRLAIFSGGFTLEEASAVVASDEIAASDVADCTGNLVTKSLLTANVGGSDVIYQLLETTRVYVREKLVESGGLEGVARRHAEYYQHLLEGAEVEWRKRPIGKCYDNFRRCIDEVRAAMDWAFSDRGDSSTGVALTLAAVPLWFEMSMMVEARSRIEQALSIIERGSVRDLHHEMQLLAALGSSLLYITGETRIGIAWTKALELADTLDDPKYLLHALWGLWAYRITTGEYRAALTLAQRFRSVADRYAGGSNLPAIADRMTGHILHFLGDQTAARRHFDSMLDRYGVLGRSDLIRFPIDQRVGARAALARALWLQGFPDQAMRTAKDTVAEARALDHSMSLCYALALADCPVALFAGDLATAEQSVAMLLDHSVSHGLALWHAWGRGLHGTLLIRQDDLIGGLQLLRGALDELRGTPFPLPYVTFLGELAEALGRAGTVGKGLATIDEALDRTQRTEERWCTSELLRIKGDLMLLEGSGTAAATAEDLFAESLAWARRQEVLSWELRTANSLARLRRSQGRIPEAHDLLASVYGRFKEGFGTADLITAKQLIGELR